jgi:hypothetical protein
MGIHKRMARADLKPFLNIILVFGIINKRKEATEWVHDRP